MPTIVHDDAFSNAMIKKIMDHYLGREGREGHKWHVSDLMFPRYAVLSRIFKRVPSRDDVGFFLTGEAYHEFLQKLLGQEHSEVRGELLNVLGTADYFNGDTLLEIKTSRKWTIPELPQDHYIEQAGYYCAIFGKSTARIMVVFPTAGRKWDGGASSTVEIRTWNVTFTDGELADIKARMSGLTSHLDKALVSSDVKGLPECPDWKYGSIERDAEKKEYFIKVRCPFALEGYCSCNEQMKDELKRRNDNRRIKPEQSSTTKSSIASRYKK